MAPPNPKAKRPAAKTRARARAAADADEPLGLSDPGVIGAAADADEPLGVEEPTPPPKREVPRKPRVPTPTPQVKDTTGQELALLAKNQAKRKRGGLTALAGAAAVLLVGGVALVAVEEKAPSAAEQEEAEVELTVDADGGVQRVTRKEKRAISRLLTGAPAPSSPRPTARPTAPAQEPLPPTPTIELATGRVRSLEPEELARSIAQDKGGAIQLCYERELKKNPRLKGRVVVELDLVAPQKVSRVVVRDNLRKPAFTTCVKRTMKKLFFPSLREDLSIEIPFDLRSPGL